MEILQFNKFKKMLAKSILIVYNYDIPEENVY